MYILFFQGNSPEGGPEASIRCFSKVASARKAMVTEYNSAVARHGIGRIPTSYQVVKSENHIRTEFSDHVFDWKVLKAVPED